MRRPGDLCRSLLFKERPYLVSQLKSPVRYRSLYLWRVIQGLVEKLPSPPPLHPPTHPPNPTSPLTGYHYFPKYTHDIWPPVGFQGGESFLIECRLSLIVPTVCMEVNQHWRLIKRLGRYQVKRCTWRCAWMTHVYSWWCRWINGQQSKKSNNCQQGHVDFAIWRLKIIRKWVHVNT